MAWTYSWQGEVREVPAAEPDAAIDFFETEREAAEAALAHLRARLDESRRRSLREVANGAQLLEDILALRRAYEGL